MALGTPVYGAVAYSGAGGTSVAPAYPTNTTGDQLLLIIGMKPSTANSGSVTTPSGWTLVTSIVGAGGYGATLGNDTGNTNLFVYTRTAPTGGLSGSLTVTVATNNVCWAIIGEVTPQAGATVTVTGWTASDTTAGNVSAPFTTGSGITANDQLHFAMCIPTDVTTPAQFSGYALSATGVTFGTITEVGEPDSATGNDIGGFLAWGSVSSGTSSGNTTLTVTAGGTTTNVRGALVLIGLREVALARTITIDEGAYTVTGTDANIYYYALSAKNDGVFFDELLTTYKGVSTPNQIMRVRTSAVAQLNFKGSFEFYPDGTNNGGYPVEAIWQYRTIGGSWTDVGTAIANTQQAIVVLGVLDTTGLIDFTTTLTTGLSASTSYDVQLLWRRTTSSPTTTNMVGLPINVPPYDYPTVSAVVATGYTITIDSGSYSLTGTAVGLVRGRRIIIDSGSYSLTGTAVNLARGRRVIIDSGSYSVTGSAVGLTYGRRIIIDAGSYALSGTAVGLVSGRRIVIDGGSYSLTGTDVTLTYTAGRTITIDSGSYSLSGSAVGLLAGKRIVIDSGSYAVTGTAVGLVAGRRVIIDSGSYTLTGSAVGLNYARPIVINSGSYALTGSAVNLTYGRRIVIDSGSYALSGSAVNLVASRRVTIDAGSYSLTGANVDLTYVFGRVITIDIGSYSLSGSSVGTLYGRRIVLDSGSYSLSGSSVNLAYGRRIVIDSGAYALTGTAVNLVSGRRLIIDSGAYAVSGSAVGLVFNRRIVINSGAYSLTGSAVGLVFGRRLIVNVGAYTYTGTAVGLFRNRRLVVDSGAYILIGADVGLIYSTGANNLYLGASPVVAVKLGTAPVVKAYVGSTQVLG